MSTSTLTFHGRLPGVDCRPALPPAEQPIRGDIAAFVGFAERGPVDTPVPVVDYASFTAVFGGDYVLASEGGKPVYAALPAAVKAFFDNGGVRCYAVRVTGPNPATASWALPGVQIWQPDGTVSDVLVEAAWPGSWSAGLRVSTTPIARPLAAGAEYRRAAGHSRPARPEKPGRHRRGSAGRPARPRSGTGPAAALRPGRLGGRGRRHHRRRADLPAGGRRLATAARPPGSGRAGRPALVAERRLGPAAADGPRRAATQEEGQLLLVERFPDLAYASFSTVLQPVRDTPPSPAQPALDRSMDLRASTANDAAAATGLIVPVAGLTAGPPLVEGDEKLDAFDPVAIFLDERLPSGVTVFSLIANADALTTLALEPVQLRGIYSLLAVEEVAMIACPDLAQRGWSVRAPLPADPEPPPPPPPPPPDWSDFRCCEVEPPPVPPACRPRRP